MTVRPEHRWLLGRRAPWRAARLSPQLERADDGHLRLRPRPGAGRPLGEVSGAFGGLTEPTGVAVDGDGGIWLLDRGGPGGGPDCDPPPRLLRFDPCAGDESKGHGCGAFVPVPCFGHEPHGPRALEDPRGLAASPRGDLYVTDPGHGPSRRGRVLVVSAKGLVLRAIWTGERLPSTPRQTPPWEPWDVAVAPPGVGGPGALPGCTVWISDRAGDRVLRFDHHGRLRGEIHEAEPGTPLAAPTHLAVDGDGRLYVAQEGRDDVVVYDAGGTFLERLESPRQTASASTGGRFPATALATDAAGNLYVSTDGGVFLHPHRQAPCPPRPVADPCRILAFDADGRPLALTADGLAALDPEESFEASGLFVSEALDSRIPDCAWHRVVLHGRVPAGSRVVVDTLTSGETLTDAQVAALPAERWRRSAIRLAPPAGVPDVDPWHALVQSPPGRYLWLRLAVESDGAATPELAAAEIEFPRSSSLERLPAVYRQDEPSRHFLDRFLALFDGFQGEIHHTLDELPGLLDARSTPADEERDFLSWLGCWMGLAFDHAWPEDARRRLLAHAHELYRRRGTVAGLKLHVALFVGREPQLLEHFRLRRWLHLGGCGAGPGARLGDCTELWGPDLTARLQLDEDSNLGEFQLLDTGDPATDPFGRLAHRVSVYLAADDVRQRALRRIVQQASPAHVEAELVLVEPRLRIGQQARIGVDSQIGDYPAGVVLHHEPRLGRGTVLSASPDEAAPPTFRLGARSRIGTSTRID